MMLGEIRKASQMLVGVDSGSYAAIRVRTDGVEGSNIQSQPGGIKSGSIPTRL